MKAWKVGLRYEFYAYVVFAETRGKAKQRALYLDGFEDAFFTDIEAVRLPAADAMYNGRCEMDWYDPNDRIFLVKECNFTCEYLEPDDCTECPAKEYCGEYEAYLKEVDEREGANEYELEI